MPPAVDALAFDVFGTVVDWRGSIIAEGQRLFGDTTDWPAFADAWSHAYGKFVTSANNWTNLDKALERACRELAPKYGIPDPGELATVWNRLRAWPDAITGFARLHPHYTLAALTNANIVMLYQLADSTGLPWDRLLSAEVARAYKPDPAIYQMAIEELGLHPNRVMMVAAHTFDLNAAHKAGMRTALITRAGEPGSNPSGLDHEADVIAPDLEAFSQAMVVHV
jgi:2-haloacid dehalogenase